MAMFQHPSRPDVNIHYEIFGGLSEVDLFFIHGNLASRHWWYPSLEIMRKKPTLGANRSGRVVLAEFRGCGESSAPRSYEDVKMELFAEDFVELTRFLNFNNSLIVGHSTGGFVAALMMTQEPALYAGAVLLDPVGMRGVKFDGSMQQAFEQMKSDKDLLALVLGSTIHNLNPQEPFFKNVLVEDGFKSVKQVGHWVIQALDGVDIQSQVQKIQKPVLILHGEFDTLLPQSESEEFARNIPKGQFEVIPGQGHCCNYENPEMFVARLFQFASEIESL
jgi:3-oxoadipate enol-lactonase